ncbi:MAG: hypothetical protein ACREOR_09410 [Candidatus Binatia bacterium]
MARTSEKPRVGNVTIATVASREEARRITAKLEAVGIECFLIDERGSTVGGRGRLRFGCINVQVDRANVERAVQSLRERDINDCVNLHPNESARLASRFRFRVGGWTRTLIEIMAIVGVALLLAKLFF